MASPLTTEFAPAEFLTELSAALNIADERVAAQAVTDVVSVALRSVVAEVYAHGHAPAYFFGPLNRLFNLDRGYFFNPSDADRNLDRDASRHLLTDMEKNLDAELEEFREMLRNVPTRMGGVR